MKDELLDAVQKGDAATAAQLLDTDLSLLTAKAANGVSAVLLAMYHGHSEIARLFIERNAVLDLPEAAAIGQVERVRQLVLESPAAVNEFSADGFSPLALAAFFGQAEVVRLLLDRGADVNAEARNPMRVQAIHAAAARNDVALVRMLIEHGADANARQQAGFTPLHAAAQNGNDELVDILLAHGADPAAASDDGKTAAALASERGHAALAQRLGGRSGNPL